MCLRLKTEISSLMIAHRRQDHDVDGRVGVEPEEVLEEHRVAAQRRIEDADARAPARRSAAAA